jgi:hypothetical protein
MQRDVIIAIMGTLKTAYPRFYANMTRKEAEEAISLWQSRFSETDPRLLKAAVETLIDTLQYPPTIAEVKNKIYELTTNEVPPIDYWNELEHATRNCLYREQQVFDNLSEPVKRFLGSPAQLRELALSDAATFNTVTKGQFLKQIEIINKRVKENSLMLPEVRELIMQIESNTKFLS